MEAEELKLSKTVERHYGNMINFKFFPLREITQSKLVYRSEDFAFDIEPILKSGIGSVLVNDLQLEIDENGRILYVWGFCPYQIWKCTDFLPPSYLQGSLAVDLETEIVPGVSHRLTKAGAWSVFVNPEIGWVCVGEANTPPGVKSVEFAFNSIAVLEGDFLKAIWLHPEHLPESVIWDYYKTRD